MNKWGRLQSHAVKKQSRGGRQWGQRKGLPAGAFFYNRIMELLTTWQRALALPWDSSPFYHPLPPLYRYTYM